MKHIKLFEAWSVGVGSFTEKYDNIKPLPQTGYMNGNLDELRAVAKYLETKGFGPAYSDEVDLQSIVWNAHSYYNLYDHKITQNTNDTLHFTDYFKLKHEYRGHNLKKFGV